MSATVRRTSSPLGHEVVLDGEVVGHFHKSTQGTPVLSGAIMVGRTAPRGYYARRSYGRPNGGTSYWFPTQRAAVAYVAST